MKPNGKTYIPPLSLRRKLKKLNARALQNFMPNALFSLLSSSFWSGLAMGYGLALVLPAGPRTTTLTTNWVSERAAFSQIAFRFDSQDRLESITLENVEEFAGLTLDMTDMINYAEIAEHFRLTYGVYPTASSHQISFELDGISVSIQARGSIRQAPTVNLRRIS